MCQWIVPLSYLTIGSTSTYWPGPDDCVSIHAHKKASVLQFMDCYDLKKVRSLSLPLSFSMD